MLANELLNAHGFRPNYGTIIDGKSLKLNIGSGNKIYPGFLNIDKTSLSNVHIIWDLEDTPLPFSENSVSEVIAEHILEHINHYVPLMEDLYRICEPGGSIKIFVPYFRYEGAFRDPTHVKFFTEYSFEYFKEGYEYAYYSKARFDVKKVELRTTSKTSIRNIHKRIVNIIPFKRFLNIFLWNLYTEIYFELEVLKNGEYHENSGYLSSNN